MQKRNKKLLGILACAASLSGVAAGAVQVSKANISEVKAATNSVGSRQLGVDVASYQSNDMSGFSNSGSQFAIVKVSEGTNYRNPKASSQISSALKNNMMPMAYHFATFGANSSAAVAEANYAVSSAKALGLPSGSYIACDWESGQSNNISSGKNPSANAILAFMKQIQQSGYKPLLYSGAYLLNNNINTSTILSQFPNSLWVASYAQAGRIDNPNFNYFPSMDGVAIWQFTDNWCGLNVDGNISLIDLHKDVQKKSTTPKSKPAANIQKKTGVAYAPIINNNPNWKIALLDGDGHYTGKYIKTNTSWKVFDVKIIKGTKCYKLGSDKQWAPAKYLQMK